VPVALAMLAEEAVWRWRPTVAGRVWRWRPSRARA
jgi:hypothetical protein